MVGQKISRRAGASLALLVLLVAPASAQQSQQPAVPDEQIVVTGQRPDELSRWMRAESPNFVLYGRSEEDLVAHAQKLERFDNLLRIITGVTEAAPADKLPIYLVNGRLELNRLRTQFFPQGSFPTGYYSASPSGMVLAADRQLDRRRRTGELPYSQVWLFSEYARHFLLHHSRSAYLPAWYVDGFGFYMGTTDFKPTSVEYGRSHPGLATALQNQRWEPMAEIISGRAARGWMYSAQSLLLVHYIFATESRVRSFHRYLAAVRAGAEPLPAFEAAFGMNMSALRIALRRHMTAATFVRADLAAFPEPVVNVATLPRAANDLLLDQAALRIGIPEERRRRTVLERAEQVAAQQSDDLSRRVLFHAAALNGAPAPPGRTLEEMIAQAPGDAELLYLMGLRHLVAGRSDEARRPAHFREARRWFARAYGVEARYFPALYRYAESLSTEPNFVSEGTQNILLLAAEVAPQATQIRVTAAMMLMLDNQGDLARRLLQSINVSPRDPASEQVPALLALARAGQRPTREALIDSFRYEAVWKDINCC